MVETELLTRFLQSGESVAVVRELKDDIIIEQLETQAKRTTQTLLNQFFETMDVPSEISNPEVVIPVFYLGKLLQSISLHHKNPMKPLQDTISNYIEELDLENVKKTLSETEIPPTRMEMVIAILQIIKTLLEGV